MIYFRSVSHGNEFIVNSLIKGKAKLNIQNTDGDTPLHIACQEGQERSVAILAESGSIVNIKNNNGATPYDLCAYKKLRDILTKYSQ